MIKKGNESKVLYRKFCNEVTVSSLFPLFAQPFWLDIFCENWEVNIIVENDRLIAALPYCTKGNLLTKRIYLPDVNFYQTILFAIELSQQQQQDYTNKLVEQLPVVLKSFFKFLPKHENLSLSNFKYKKEEYPCYFIATNQSILLSKHHLRHLQKGIKNNYTILESNSISKSFQLIQSTFLRQKTASKITLNTFEKLNEVCTEKNCGKAFDCLDDNKNLLATIFILEDFSTVYYFLSGYDVSFKNSGAMTTLLNYAINYALQKQKTFNFCGSRKKSIADFFIGFGAKEMNVIIWKKQLI